jgi:hypothetical protein
VHIEVRVDHHGHNRLAVELQRDPELVSIAVEKLRAPNFRLVHVFVVIVILKHSEYLRESGAGNEDHANPVVDETVRNRNGASVLFSMQLFNIELAPAESCVCFLPGRIGKAIDDEETTAAQIVGVLGFGGANVAIKSSRSIRFQLRPLRRSHKQTNREALEQGPAPAASDQLNLQPSRNTLK